MHPTCVSEESCFVTNSKMPSETLQSVQKWPGTQYTYSVIGSASKMIHLSGNFVVKKGQYSPKCVL